MKQEITSVAIFEVLPGKAKEALASMNALMAALAAGGYSRDVLYRDGRSGREFVLLRQWKSEQQRRAALEDAAVLRCWAKLAEEIRTVKVYETLEEVESFE